MWKKKFKLKEKSVTCLIAMLPMEAKGVWPHLTNFKHNNNLQCKSDTTFIIESFKFYISFLHHHHTMMVYKSWHANSSVSWDLILQSFQVTLIPVLYSQFNCEPLYCSIKEQGCNIHFCKVRNCEQCYKTTFSWKRILIEITQYFSHSLSCICLWNLGFETQVYKMTKDSRDEIHETYSNLLDHKIQDNLQKPDTDPIRKKLVQYK